MIVATNASVRWHAAQRWSMWPVNEWQLVHEPAFGFVAMAGMMFNCATAWAFETGAGANALVYQYAAATVTSPITNSAQVKNATGHRDIRSLVGVQLKCALPLRLPAFGN